MRILLDTHVLYWSLFEPEKLPSAIRSAIADPDNAVLFSAASIWEMAIKSALGRIDFQVEVEDVAGAATQSGFAEVPVRAMVAAGVATLPLYHRDPFDRLLIAQAMAEPALFYTRDEALARYTDLVRRV
jgi:PIN domain nuclease of toxin-antitoxin system